VPPFCYPPENKHNGKNVTNSCAKLYSKLDVAEQTKHSQNIKTSKGKIPNRPHIFTLIYIFNTSDDQSTASAEISTQTFSLN
jgi:hypothetical protein